MVCFFFLVSFVKAPDSQFAFWASAFLLLNCLTDLFPYSFPLCLINNISIRRSCIKNLTNVFTNRICVTLLSKIQACDFTKLKSGTFLRVVYMGIIRITGCTGCCKRWYFTFNSKECSNPAPIDGVIYHGINANIHRPANIEGYCGGISAGKVKVGFSVGDCARVKAGDAWTSWYQTIRIIIEEVEPPVA